MNIFNNTIHVGEQTIRNKDTIVSKNDSNSWWNKSTNNKTRIMLCGTYPIGTSNGYSKVVYYICKYLQKIRRYSINCLWFSKY